jgi:hypothetical protein
MATKTLAELSECEKKKALEQRSKGKSIKSIAKEMHISDKRVSAFLRPIEEKKRKHKANKRLFDRFVAHACSYSNDAVKEFVATISASQLSQIQNVLVGRSKKEQKIELRKSLEELFETFLGASMSLADVAIWTMPAKYKKLWMSNILEEPKMPTVSEERMK